MEQSFNFESILSEIEIQIKKLKQENSELRSRLTNSGELETLKEENKMLMDKCFQYEEQLNSVLKRLDGLNNQAKTPSSQILSSSADVVHSKESNKLQNNNRDSLKEELVEDKNLSVSSHQVEKESKETEDKKSENSIQDNTSSKKDVDLSNKNNSNEVHLDDDDDDPFGDDDDPFADDDDDLEDDDNDFFKNVISKDKE